MKNLLYYTLFISYALFTVSCAKEKKETESSKTAHAYHIDADHSSVQWTAYKTTDKVPVKGTFKEIKILNSQEGNSPSAALQGLEFEIPVSSIFSKDTIRDGKLNKFFFAVMENTMSLKGAFKLDGDEKGNLALTMNGLTKDLPFAYEISKDTILISASMDLNNWQAQTALESLNQACLELHTGPDGVSKTWNEVSIQAKILTAPR